MNEISSKNINLSTVMAAVGKNNIDPSQYGDFFEYSVGETSAEISAKSDVSLITIPKLTLTEGGSKFYSPVATELSEGTPHWRGSAPGAFDVGPRSDVAASPYAWDISSLVPVGTNSVEIWLYGTVTTASQTDNFVVYAWDYDKGSTLSQFIVTTYGARLDVPGIPASSGTLNRNGSGVFKIKIGSSRKIYMCISNASMAFYATLRTHEE